MGKGRQKNFDCVDLKDAIQAEIGEEEKVLGTAEAERRHDLWVRTSQDPLAVWWRSMLGIDVVDGPSPRGRKKHAAA